MPVHTNKPLNEKLHYWAHYILHYCNAIIPYLESDNISYKYIYDM